MNQAVQNSPRLQYAIDKRANRLEKSRPSTHSRVKQKNNQFLKQNYNQKVQERPQTSEVTAPRR